MTLEYIPGDTIRTGLPGIDMSAIRPMADGVHPLPDRTDSGDNVRADDILEDPYTLYLQRLGEALDAQQNQKAWQAQQTAAEQRQQRARTLRQGAFGHSAARLLALPQFNTEYRLGLHSLNDRYLALISGRESLEPALVAHVGRAEHPGKSAEGAMLAAAYSLQSVVPARRSAHGQMQPLPGMSDLFLETSAQVLLLSPACRQARRGEVAEHLQTYMQHYANERDPILLGQFGEFIHPTQPEIRKVTDAACGSEPPAWLHRFAMDSAHQMRYAPSVGRLTNALQTDAVYTFLGGKPAGGVPIRIADCLVACRSLQLHDFCNAAVPVKRALLATVLPALQAVSRADLAAVSGDDNDVLAWYDAALQPVPTRPTMPIGQLALGLIRNLRPATMRNIFKGD